MTTTTSSLHDLTVADLMSRELITIHHKMSLRGAAHLLRRADVTGAPVVDELGRCVGILSAVDFLRWIEEEGLQIESRPIRTCPYQTKGRLISEKDVVACTKEEGACSLQAMTLMSDGRHAPVCLMPHDILSDWQQVIEGTSCTDVGKYMTTDIVTVKPDVHVTELARMMIDAHIHRVVVIDEHDIPVGIVSATDVLAAVAREEPD